MVRVARSRSSKLQHVGAMRNDKHVARRSAKQPIGNAADEQPLEEEPPACAYRQEFRALASEHASNRGRRRIAAHDHTNALRIEAGCGNDGLQALPCAVLRAAVPETNR